MSSLKYYIIDTETTGLKAGYHEMTEISIIRCDDRHQLTRRIKAEFPDRASEQALSITGKTIKDIIQGSKKENIVDECNAFFTQDGLTPEHRCMVAHNAPFDKRFCHALWGSCGEEFPAICWMDTIKFTKVWGNQIGRLPSNFKLATVLKFANITPMPGAHDAGSDARNTYLIWKKGIDKGIDHLEAIKRYPHILNG